MQYTVALIAFHPITTALFKTTIARMRKQGYPIVLHETDDTPSLYLVDSDNEDACEQWRKQHPIVLAPIVFLGSKNYDLPVPKVSKPIRLDALMTAIMDGLQSPPPRSTLTWRMGYPSVQKALVNPLVSLIKPRVVLVDAAVDAAVEMRSYLALKLQQYNVDIEVFDDAETAWPALELSWPMAVFTEVSLPGITGFQLSKHICEHSPITSVVLVSFAPSAFDKALGVAAGAQFHLSKPLEDEAIHTTMEALMLSWKKHFSTLAAPS